ncbi:MAG: lysophospholipid acyltransferase family protein [Candidatus Lokiarchaeota archaeon]
MVINETDLKQDKSEFEEKHEIMPNDEEQKEKLFKKPHQNLLYKILKLNPIDPLNDFYHKIIDLFELTESEKRIQYWIGEIYVRQAARLFWRHEAVYEDGELFPEYESGILVSNHESHLDPFFSGIACWKKVNFMSKPENFKTPIVRTFFRNLSAFSLGERDNKEDFKKAWEYAKDRIEHGEWIGIFPEGTRSTDGKMGEFKTGAVRLAIETGVPIVPMGIIGSKNALPKGKLIMKPTKVLVRVGRPIYYDQYKGKLTPELARKLSDELRQKVQDLIDGKGNFSKIKKKFQEKLSEDLSIESLEDTKKEKKSNPLAFFKPVINHLLTSIDDGWLTLLHILDEFGLRYKFQKLVWRFSSTLVHEVICNNIAPYKTIGYENVPNEGAAVICSNHNSEWDVILNAVAVDQTKKRVLWQMSKQQLFQIPVVNAWVRTHYAFPLKRGESDIQCFNYAKELLDEGQLVMVYPEGTTSKGGGEVLEGHTGAVRLAIKAKVPIIPIGITGTEKTYPKHAKMLNFGYGSIFNAGKPFMEHAKYFNKPIPKYEELKRLINNLMQRIKDLLMYNEPKA